MRSRIEDWDFKKNIVSIRGRKDSRKVDINIRTVNMHPRLRKVMKNWFEFEHPGGMQTICLRREGEVQPVSRDQMNSHFKNTFKATKWSVLKGWHVFRHSFCSNAARIGIPDPIIDAWMGHSGDEAIKKRYRHLFPSDKKDFMYKLFK